HVTHGTLTLNGTSGLSFTFSDANGTGQGDGTADATMTFRGPLTAINTALDGLIYTPNHNFSSSDTLEITVNDLARTSPPGPWTSVGRGSIIVVNLNNDPPSVPDRSLTIPEDTSVSVTLTATDPESDPVTFSVSVNPLHGTVNVDSTTGAFTSTANANYNGA